VRNMSKMNKVKKQKKNLTDKEYNNWAEKFSRNLQQKTLPRRKNSMR
jgi:hypothetical protein